MGLKKNGILKLINENVTLLESYKTYQGFFQSHTVQLNGEISAMNLKIRDSEAILEVCFGGNFPIIFYWLILS